MVKVPLCSPTWWEDPRVLLTDSWLTRWNTRSTAKKLCFSERVNTLTRTLIVSIVIALVFSLFNNDISTTLVYSLVLGLIITLPDIIDMVKAPYIQENFEASIHINQPVVKASSAPPVNGADDSYDDGNSMTLPSPKNPFMNVSPDEVKYNPNRPEAASVDTPVVKATLDDFFRVNWFSDPTDVFGRNQSQREFITMPSTTIPSDRESYQNWLYKIPGKTCKEGGRDACVGGSQGAAVPWLNIND